MALSSMTGFARGHGVAGSLCLGLGAQVGQCQGLDLKLRLPPGWDAIEAAVRARAAEALSRGSVFANLTVSREGAAPVARINEPVLNAVLATLKGLSGKVDGAPPSARRHSRAQGRDGGERSRGERGRAQRRRSRVVAGFGAGAEGPGRDAPHRRRRRSDKILTARLVGDRRARRARRSDARPQARGDQGAARRAGRRRCSKPRSASIADRLHQEAILLATKTDIREELDRLAAHVAQAKKLLADGGPIGRKLDFLSQELNRESNTLCAKANDLELTNIGLELKAVVEQFREQVQNLE